MEKTGSSNKIKLIRYTDVPSFSTQIETLVKNQQGSIVIVGSSIAQSKSIVKISRVLRKFYNDGCQLCYFVAIVRTYTQKEFEYIKTNLLYSKKFALKTHVFDSLLDIYIPDERYRNITPWQQELDLLIDFFKRNDLHKFDKNALNKFEERLEFLKDAAKDGLINNLFWKSPADERLSLNPGFIFFDFDLPPLSQISQADVYFTIASVLHHLRTDYKEGNQIILEQSEQQRKILDPENFSRFNDSVIQASILRAAQNIELDYSYDNAASSNMRAFILDLLMKKESSSYEFMLALAAGKVKLTKEDSITLMEQVLNAKDPIIDIFQSIKMGEPIESNKELINDF